MEHIENFKRAREQRAEYERVGVAWSSEETRALMRAYVDDAPISDIARTHSRTERGIISRVNFIADRVSRDADAHGIHQKIIDLASKRQAMRLTRELARLRA